MRLRPARLLRAVAAALLLCAPLAAPARARVVIVGIDGASWNVLDPMLARGELPHLAALARRGATARLESLEPLNSPAIWTSLATGRRPRSHGVTDFQATTLALRVPTLFERLAAAGTRVGLYDWLVTWPPPAFPGGFVVPGWLRHDDRVQPPDLWERIGVERWAYDPTGAHSPEAFFALVQREAREKPARFVRMLDTFDPQVAAVTFYGVDVASHRFWHAAFPEQFHGALPPVPDWEHGALAAEVRAVDGALGEIATALRPDDVLLVVSDHGFRAEDGIATIWVPRLEPALEAAGLDPARDGFHVVTRFGIAILEVHEGPSAEREPVLRRIRALLEKAHDASGAPLFRVDWLDVVPRPADVHRSAVERLRQWAVRQVVHRLHHLRTARRGYAYVFARPRADVLARSWPDGQVVMGGVSRRVDEVFGRDAFSGAHDPVGIFLAAGGPLAARPDRDRLSALDLAPLVLYLAGAPLPDDLEGRLPSELIDPARLAARPPERVPAAALPGLPPQPLPDVAAGSDDGLVERLRALGYVR